MLPGGVTPAEDGGQPRFPLGPKLSSAWGYRFSAGGSIWWRGACPATVTEPFGHAEAQPEYGPVTTRPRNPFGVWVRPTLPAAKSVSGLKSTHKVHVIVDNTRTEWPRRRRNPAVWRVGGSG